MPDIRLRSKSLSEDEIMDIVYKNGESFANAIAELESKNETVVEINHENGTYKVIGENGTSVIVSIN